MPTDEELSESFLRIEVGFTAQGLKQVLLVRLAQRQAIKWLLLFQIRQSLALLACWCIEYKSVHISAGKPPDSAISVAAARRRRGTLSK